MDTKTSQRPGSKRSSSSQVAMDMKTAQQFGSKRIYQRTPEVCSFWKAGRCTRRPCPFLHGELPQPTNGFAARPAPYRESKSINKVWRNPNAGVRPTPSPKPSKIPVGEAMPSANKQGTRQVRGVKERVSSDGHSGPVPVPKLRKNREKGLIGVATGEDLNKVCSYFLSGECNYGDHCRYLHAWYVGGGFSHVATLEGHRKAVTGIALPSGSNKLYTGSKDESVRVWDCGTGKCIYIINLGVEVGCMISEGPWVFIGITNAVKAWNTENGAHISLVGPKGQTYALVTGNDMLFAGIQDGSIVAWKFGVVGDCLEPSACLTGHRLGVVSLVVGAMKLYSGSMDHTIKVWDLVNLQCVHTLTEHSSAVMSVLCWDRYLLSCSMDKSIKVWAATESGELHVIYTQSEEHGVLSLFGMFDKQAKPVLFISYNDDTICPCDLPSFSKRGRIFNKAEVRAIQEGPDGLFFTGDGTGEVKVWKWLASEEAAPA